MEPKILREIPPRPAHSFEGHCLLPTRSGECFLSQGCLVSGCDLSAPAQPLKQYLPSTCPAATPKTGCGLDPGNPSKALVLEISTPNQDVALFCGCHTSSRAPYMVLEGWHGVKVRVRMEVRKRSSGLSLAKKMYVNPRSCAPKNPVGNASQALGNTGLGAMLTCQPQAPWLPPVLHNGTCHSS